MLSKIAVAAVLSLVVAADRAVQAAPLELAPVSYRTFSAGDDANGDSFVNDLTPDGRYAVITSRATNLVAGVVDLNAVEDLYVVDLETSSWQLLSHRQGDPLRTATGGPTRDGKISADGRYVVAFSEATDLLAAGVLVDRPQVVLFDLETGTRSVVSTNGFDPTFSVNDPVNSFLMTPDARYIAIDTTASNVFPGFIQAGGQRNIFLYDRVAGTRRLVTPRAGTTNTSSNGISVPIKISSDGRFVLFNSLAGDLLAPPAAALSTSAVYLWDRNSGGITLISRSAASGQPVAAQATDLSADGQVALYSSESAEILAGMVDVNDDDDLFAYHHATGQQTLISRTSHSSLATTNGRSFGCRLSADGRYVYFSSRGTNLVAGVIDGNGSADVFRFDRSTGVRTLVTARDGEPTRTANGESFCSGAAASGQFVFYNTSATDLDLTVEDTGSLWDLYRGDPATGENLLASRDGSANRALNATAINYVWATGGGDVVAFGADLGDANVKRQLFAFDAGTAIATRHSAAAVDGIGTSSLAGSTFALSRSGRYLLHRDYDQVMRYDSQTKTQLLISRNAANPEAPANGTSNPRAFSGDERVALISSDATDLVAGVTDSNNSADIFLVDAAGGPTVLVSHRFDSATTAAAGASKVAWMSSDTFHFLLLNNGNDLAAGISGGSGDSLYFYDRPARTAQLISRSHLSPLQRASGASLSPMISADQRFVYFSSAATDLVPGFVDGNGSGTNRADLYLFDRQLQQMRLVTRQAGTAANGTTGTPTIRFVSNDGRYLFFNTNRIGGLIAGGNSAAGTVALVYDRVADTHSLLYSPGAPNVPCLNSSSVADLDVEEATPDGRWVLFSSSCPGLVPGDTNSLSDTFLLDRSTGQLELISHRPANPGQPLTFSTRAEEISEDGRTIFYRRMTPYHLWRYERTSKVAQLASYSLFDEGAPVGAADWVVDAGLAHIAWITTSTEVILHDTSDDIDLYLVKSTGVFSDGFESGNTAAWSLTVP